MDRFAAIFRVRPRRPEAWLLIPRAAEDDRETAVADRLGVERDVRELPHGRRELRRPGGAAVGRPRAQRARGRRDLLELPQLLQQHSLF